MTNKSFFQFPYVQSLLTCQVSLYTKHSTKSRRQIQGGHPVWRFPNFGRYCRPFPTPRAEFQKLRWLGFSLTLHCSALFNHGQVTPFIVYIAAFSRFMRHSRIQKHFNRHMYSRCMVRSGEAVARAQTLGVQLQTGSGFSLNAK